MIIRGRELSGEHRHEADVVIVGTGAGGGMAFRELALQGLRVIALEEGAYLVPRDFNQREDDMLSLLFQEGGARSTRDLSIRVLMGRGVGGSTVHNTNLCKRTPPEILDEWERDYQVSGCTERDLRPVFEEVERLLSVSEIPEHQRNLNNRLLERGVKALGWRGGPLSHNRIGCVGSGFCELGCAYDAKQNTSKVLVPAALATGNATLIADAKATKIVHEKGRVSGVSAALLDAKGKVIGNLQVDAKVVVLAGAAVGSAALALASSLPDPHDQLGRGLRIHPGGVVAGVFDERVDGVYGIPQSYECTEFLDFSPGSDKRVWITTAFAHPIGAAAIMPGFGASHMSLMRKYAHIGVLTAMVHDETSGRVRLAKDGAPILDYKMLPSDCEQLALGLRKAAEILFAAGAREVILPAISPVRMKKPAEVEAITSEITRPHEIPLTAVHPMGTMRLGDDPKRAVVKSTGEHHQLDGLFVLDGSLFPTSLGGPPQISIYTFSKHLSRYVVERARA